MEINYCTHEIKTLSVTLTMYQLKLVYYTVSMGTALVLLVLRPWQKVSSIVLTLES